MPFPFRPISLLLLCAGALPAQEAALRLFLDPKQIYVDQAFLKKELTWVDWVRERTAAHVHLILAAQPSGGGGEAYEFRFLGQGPFAGMEDVLTLSLPGTATPAEVRAAIASRIALGLARFAARTPQADRLRVQPAAGTGPTNTQPRTDPWNAWVYRVEGNGNLNGESSSSFSNAWLSLGASRVTAEDFLRMDLSGNWNRSRFDLEDSSLVTSSKAFYGNFAAAKGLGPHWTLGLLASGARSTRANISSSARLAPGLEYSVWDYGESTRRQLTFLYQAGAGRNVYFEETMFGKMRQTVMDNRFTAALVMNQPWGTVSASAYGSAYLHDWGLNSLGLYGSMNLRVHKGLNFNLYLNYSRVRDQLALPRSGATDEEVLLRLKEIRTSYRYSVYLGLSYTFGSIFNNAVNPRFRSSGGYF